MCFRPQCRYGYRYECINGLRPDDDGSTACTLALESFRGCPCSDAVGRQKEYQEIMQRASLVAALKRCEWVVLPEYCCKKEIVWSLGGMLSGLIVLAVPPT